MYTTERSATIAVGRTRSQSPPSSPDIPVQSTRAHKAPPRRRDAGSSNDNAVVRETPPPDIMDVMDMEPVSRSPSLPPPPPAPGDVRSPSLPPPGMVFSSPPPIDAASAGPSPCARAIWAKWLDQAFVMGLDADGTRLVLAPANTRADRKGLRFIDGEMRQVHFSTGLIRVFGVDGADRSAPSRITLTRTRRGKDPGDPIIHDLDPTTDARLAIPEHRPAHIELDMRKPCTELWEVAVRGGPLLTQFLFVARETKNIRVW